MLCKLIFSEIYTSGTCCSQMESFEIQLLEDRFKIEPLENGLYRIMEGEEKVGVIFPEPDGDAVKWATQDELEAG